MKRVTLADVATHAGVSKATASLVLRNAGTLPESTRERVRKSIRTLGYVYHRGAASLRAKRSFSIGLIVPDIANPFTAEFAKGVEAVLETSGIVTLMVNAFDDVERQQKLINSLLERQVDGFVIFPAIESHSTPPEPAHTSRPEPVEGQVPTVLAVRNLDQQHSIYVGFDNQRGGRTAAEHLLSHGCRRIGFLGGESALPPRLERSAGIRAAVARTPDADLTLDLSGPAQGDWAYQAVSDLLAGDGLPDGIICHSDVVAFGLYRAIRDHAPQLLDNVHVVSHDNVAEAAWWEPPLTTVAANGTDLGRRCAEVLLDRLDHPSDRGEQILLTPELVIRRSCGCESPTDGEPR